MASQEKTPLLGGESGSNYYFLETTVTQSGDGNGGDGGAEIETLPDGVNADQFEPRVLSVKHPSMNKVIPTETEPKAKGGLFSRFFGKSDPVHARAPLKQRKAPIKVEPKVFFANERTFLAWMHIAIILAGASIAILAFSDASESRGAQIYGIVTLPVAVAFIVYAMYQYVRRAYMIRTKSPGPYDDTVGPVVLSIMLMVSIVCQFAIKLYSMSTI